MTDKIITKKMLETNSMISGQSLSISRSRDDCMLYPSLYENRYLSKKVSIDNNLFDIIYNILILSTAKKTRTEILSKLKKVYKTKDIKQAIKFLDDKNIVKEFFDIPYIQNVDVNLIQLSEELFEVYFCFDNPLIEITNKSNDHTITIDSGPCDFSYFSSPYFNNTQIVEIDTYFYLFDEFITKKCIVENEICGCIVENETCGFLSMDNMDKYYNRFKMCGGKIINVKERKNDKETDEWKTKGIIKTVGFIKAEFPKEVLGRIYLFNCWRGEVNFIEIKENRIIGSIVIRRKIKNERDYFFLEKYSGLDNIAINICPDEKPTFYVPSELKDKFLNYLGKYLKIKGIKMNMRYFYKDSDSKFKLKQYKHKKAFGKF